MFAAHEQETWMTAIGKGSRRAFTLLELMIVITMILLLVGIALPSMQGARRSAKRVACSANLRQIGQAMRMYLNQSKDFLPTVAFMPSMPSPDGKVRARLVDVFAEFVEGQTQVFKCPSDIPGGTQRPDPNFNKSFFETEGSSYFFNPYLNGKKLSDFVRSERVVDYFGGQISETELWVLHDYAPFHGKAGTPGAMNYLYIDGHVTDLER